MDDQQHAISALLRTVAIVEAPTARGHDAPSGWLWALALIATCNPLFVGRAVPRRERRADRATLAAVGGALGALIVVVAAALSGPLLDVLDVSPPSLRLAVGIVGAVAGLVRLVRRPLGPQDGRPGLSAALVPVAVPLVAAPALVMLGLGAGADLGVLFVAGCLALSVGAITALATAPADRARGRSSRSGGSASWRPPPSWRACCSWSTPSSPSERRPGQTVIRFRPHRAGSD